MKLSALILVVLTLLSCLGCGGETGPKLVKAHGTVTKGGEVLQVAGRDIGVGMVQLEFIPAEGNPATETYGAVVDAEGKFDMPGGMPPGKYKVAVRQWDPYPQTDKLGGKFAATATPIVRDVTGDQPIEIDLDKL